MTDANTILANNLGMDVIEEEMKKKEKKNNKGDKKTSNAEAPKEERIKMKYLADGEKVLVKIPNLKQAVLKWEAHSYYVKDDKEKSVLPFACQKMKGEEGDLFDKAATFLIKQASPLWNTNREEAKRIRQESNKYEAQTRYKFGFFDLDTGEEIIIDLSEQAGESLSKQLKDYEESREAYAFVLSRSGKNHNLAPHITKLTTTQQMNFDACKGKEYDVTRYIKTLYFKNERQQLWDLTKMGFDVTLIGCEVPTKKTYDATASNQEENTSTIEKPINEEKKKEAIEKVEKELNQKEIDEMVSKMDTNPFEPSEELDIDDELDIDELPA